MFESKCRVREEMQMQELRKWKKIIKKIVPELAE